MSDRSRLSTALALSMLLHLLALSFVNGTRWSGLQPEVPEFIEIDLFELPEPMPLPLGARIPDAADSPDDALLDDSPEPPPFVVPESRIVPMPDAGLELPSDTARFLSDRDNVVAEESVHRGDSIETTGGDESPRADEVPLFAEPMDIEQERSEESLPAEPGPADTALRSGRADEDVESRQLALADLLPRAGDLIIAAEPPEPRPVSRPVKRDLLPTHRVKFSTGTGVSALLPSVRDGAITLLNTKAHEFAPFVRRVAGRIFQHLQIALINAARRGPSGAGNDAAVVRATMTADGQFVGAELLEARSATKLSVPRVLMSVVGDRTFFDENPPPGAVAEDGLVHFQLRINLRVWSETRAGGRGGRRVGRTFFDGVIGVGLE